MAKYTYEAVECDDINRFEGYLAELCDGDKGRVVASNAYWNKDENAAMYFALVQKFNEPCDNPDCQGTGKAGK